MVLIWLALSLVMILMFPEVCYGAATMVQPTTIVCVEKFRYDSRAKNPLKPLGELTISAPAHFFGNPKVHGGQPPERLYVTSRLSESRKAADIWRRNSPDQ